MRTQTCEQPGNDAADHKKRQISDHGKRTETDNYSRYLTYIVQHCTYHAARPYRELREQPRDRYHTQKAQKSAGRAVQYRGKNCRTRFAEDPDIAVFIGYREARFKLGQPFGGRWIAEVAAHKALDK